MLVLVPELVGQSIFEKSNPENSSVVAAITLANKIGTSKHSGVSCHLTIGDDPFGAKISRVAGLQGQYGNFTCYNP